MDREILFRCWDKHNKEMLKVEKLQFEFGDVFIKTNKYGGYFTTNEVVLMQYTGIKDVNGTKIFEGDIVLTDGLINTKVVWDTDRLMWGLEYPKGEKVALYSFEKWDIEVVGNIYDNYELLTHQHENKGE